jgi:hypothetical protein
MTKTRRLKRGGAKFTVQPKSTKNNKSAKPSAYMLGKPKTLKRNTFLKTIKRATYKKQVSPDKYLEGVIKFLNKILSANINSKSYPMYAAVSAHMLQDVSEAMSELGIEIKDYDLEDLDDFIEDLCDTLEELIRDYQEANENDKMNAEIQMFTLANPIMESIRRTKADFKHNTKKNEADELADLLGSLTLKKPMPISKKRNTSVNDLAALFSKTGLL